MWRLALSRLLAGVPALLVVTALVFGIVRLLPGDPARILAGDVATDEVIRELRQRWQLDRPLPVQYGVYLWRLLQGDLGRSTATSLPVGPELGERFLRTLELAAAATLFAAGVGAFAGILGATRRASLTDYAAGAQPPTPEWGTMLSKARDFLRVAPLVSIFPGLTIMLTVLGLNLLGDGLRDVLDPRTGLG